MLPIYMYMHTRHTLQMLYSFKQARAHLVVHLAWKRLCIKTSCKCTTSILTRFAISLDCKQSSIIPIVHEREQCFKLAIIAKIVETLTYVNIHIRMLLIAVEVSE